MSNINSAARLRQFQKLLAQRKLDGYVVSRPVDQGFLTGYHMEGYLLLVGLKKAWAFVPDMFVDQCREVSSSCNVIGAADQRGSLLAVLKAEGMKKVAFDSEAESYSSGESWKKRGLIAEIPFAPILRETKDDGEAAVLAKSCKIAITAYKKLLPEIKPGMTENQIRARLEYLMSILGAQGPSFNIIVGSGSNSAKPHHITSERKLRNNEALLIDFGCKYGNYCSDITRTIFVGKPTEEFRKVYGIVDRAQKAGVKAVCAGVGCFDVDKVCRDIITEAGYGDKFTHTTGHGLGLEIHEFPRLSTKSDVILKEGMAVTVEPGIYLYGKFGVRIEDSVLVTKTGCKILTR
jgi:Xaa-Pro aminopeptidase